MNSTCAIAALLIIQMNCIDINRRVGDLISKEKKLALSILSKIRLYGEMMVDDDSISEIYKHPNAFMLLSDHELKELDIKFEDDKLFTTFAVFFTVKRMLTMMECRNVLIKSFKNCDSKLIKIHISANAIVQGFQNIDMLKYIRLELRDIKIRKLLHNLFGPQYFIVFFSAYPINNICF